jgi:drug/metabolite transporter (DMT)-like permease
MTSVARQFGWAAPGPTRVAAAFALLCLIWGSTWLVIKGGLADLPPFTAAAARFAVAWVVMIAIAPSLAAREGGQRPGWGLVLLMGVPEIAVSFGCVYWAETILPSGLVSVLWAVYPLLVGVASHFLLPGERLGPRQWLGLALGLLGVAALFWSDLLRAGGAAHVVAGAVLMISPIAVATANVLIKKHGAHTSAVLLNRNGFAVGALCLACAALLFERKSAASWSWPAIGSVLYLALVGTCLAFTVYFWLLRFVPATRMSLISYIVPVIAVTLGVLAGGEPVSASLGIGAALVLAGVWLATRRS